VVESRETHNPPDGAVKGHNGNGHQRNPGSRRLIQLRRKVGALTGAFGRLPGISPASDIETAPVRV
jgi:hypothetical protein